MKKNNYEERLKEYVQRLDSISSSNINLAELGVSNDDSQYYAYTERDIEESVFFVYEALLKNDFKTLPIDEYIKKVKDVWGITPEDTCKNIIDHENFFCYINPSDYESFEDGKIGDLEYLFGHTFAKNKSLYLPVNQANFLFSQVGDSVTLKPYIIHLNKYIFNNSKSSLTWLINNRPEVLESLIKNFGYVKDENLLRWALNDVCVLDDISDNVWQNLSAFLSLFAYRNFNGKVIFNQEVLTFMGEKPDKKYIDQIARFIQLTSVNYPDLDFIKSGKKLTFNERAEIYARLLYWGESIIRNHGDEKIGDSGFTYSNYMFVYMVGFLVNNNESEKYEREFERNNYYGLPKFKEYWEEAKQTKREEYETGPVRRGPEDEG